MTSNARTSEDVNVSDGMPLKFVPPDKIESPAYALQDAMVEALAGYQG